MKLCRAKKRDGSACRGAVHDHYVCPGTGRLEMVQCHQCGAVYAPTPSGKLAFQAFERVVLPRGIRGDREQGSG